MAIFQQGTFLFDPKNDTPATVARKRAIVAQILGSGSAPKTIGEGLNAIGDGIVANVLNRRADEAEKAGQESAAAAWNPFVAAFGGQQFPAAPGAAGGDTASAEPTTDYPSQRVEQAFGDVGAPSGEGKDWINSFYRNAKAAGLSDTAARLTASQAALESGFGKHAPGMNFFGIKAGKSWKGPVNNLMTTEQNPDGSSYRTRAPFRAYGDFGGAMADRNAFMARNFPGAINAGTWDEAMAGLKNGRYGAYATDLKYAKKLSAYNAMIDGGASPSTAAVTAFAGGGDIPPAPVQVASLDPSAGLPDIAPVPTPSPGPSNVPVSTGKDDRVSNLTTRSIPMQPGPMATGDAQSAFVNRMTAPQSLTGGAPMPMAGMPASAPQPARQAVQVAQASPAGPDLSRVPVTAGGNAGEYQPGQEPSLQMLMQAASNPWLNDSQKSVINLMLKQRLDPTADLDRRYKEAQIAHLTSGTPSANSSFGNLDAQARAAGLVPGTPEYQQFMLNGGGAPATFRALDMQAKAAGFQPGSPEYNEFMATRGAGLQAGAAQTAKNQADVATGGDAERVKAAGRAAGKGEGEAAVAYRSMTSKMPGLEKVVGELNKVADEATYTYAGQGLDWAMRQAGMEPREAAIARTKYIAMVDNQILPLLRDTFGAQFPVQEGESLRATLGDPNKTPTEKKQVLEAFIEQKRRDVEALALQAMGGGGQSDEDTGGGDGGDYKSKYGLE
ncbi:MAG: glucosaminidase domain-containing protein [Mesorhizobium sp.]